MWVVLSMFLSLWNGLVVCLAYSGHSIQLTIFYILASTDFLSISHHCHSDSKMYLIPFIPPFSILFLCALYILEIVLDLKFIENTKTVFVLQRLVGRWALWVQRTESRKGDLNEVMFELNLQVILESEDWAFQVEKEHVQRQGEQKVWGSRIQETES